MKCLQWNNTFFYIFIDYRGICRKGVAIHNVTEVNLQQQLILFIKIVFLNTTERLKV